MVKWTKYYYKRCLNKPKKPKRPYMTLNDPKLR